MKYAVMGSTYLLGLMFVVFGLNFWLHFIPNPPMGPAAGAYFGAIISANVLVVTKIVEVTAGALLLAGIARPFALILLAPVVVNIVLFHVTLHPEGLPAGLVAAVLLAFLGYTYRESYAPLFKKG